MRHQKLKQIKRALGYKGSLGTVEKSHLRKIKKLYNKLSYGGRLEFIDMLYKADLDKLKK